MCDMAYIAKCNCGGLVMAAVDNPEHKKDVSEMVASCIRDGFVVSKMTIKEVRLTEMCKNYGKCKS